MYRWGLFVVSGRARTVRQVELDPCSRVQVLAGFRASVQGFRPIPKKSDLCEMYR